MGNLVNQQQHHHPHDQQRSIKDTVVRARINCNLKHDVDHILNQLGLTMSDAISLYLSHIKLEGGIPFSVKIPNKTTLKTFAETDQNKNVVKVKSVREIFEKIEK